MDTALNPAGRMPAPRGDTRTTADLQAENHILRMGLADVAHFVRKEPTSQAIAAEALRQADPSRSSVLARNLGGKVKRGRITLARSLCYEIAGPTDEDYGSVDIAEILSAEVERLRAAICQTLDANGHLADGEVCTLIALKVALRESGAPWDGDELHARIQGQSSAANAADDCPLE